MSLDVEQQLRAAQSIKGEAISIPSPSFMKWEYFYPIETLAVAMAVISAASAAVFILIAVLRASGTRKQSCIATALLEGRSFLFSSRHPLLFGVYMGLWAMLAAAVATFGLMNSLSRAHTEELAPVGESAQTDMAPQVTFAELSASFQALHVATTFTQLPLALYMVEMLSLVSTLVVLLYLPWPVEGPVASLLPGFLAALFQSLSIKGDEPDDIPLWTTHVKFILALSAYVSYVYPWLYKEYCLAMAEADADIDRAVARAAIRERRKNAAAAATTQQGRKAKKQ